jgi:hypothetical protein
MLMVVHVTPQNFKKKTKKIEFPLFKIVSQQKLGLFQSGVHSVNACMM